MFETSCPKRISGSDISSRNYSTLIVLPSVPPLPNTSFVPMPYLINIWKKTTTVRVFAKFNEVIITYLWSSELEPRRQRTNGVDIFVDLGATLEDHGEVTVQYHPVEDMQFSSTRQTGNERDITMQPGRQRGALPLIRKFNEHSERLLNAAL